MADTSKKYGIAELAERGGVSRRTVRYYVRRGLLPAPTGTGRGKHYTDAHLSALIRIRELQESGVPLAEIQQRLVDPTPQTGDLPVHVCRPVARSANRAVQRWTRIAVHPDVEVHVADGGHLDDSTVVRIAAAVREVLADNRPGNRPGNQIDRQIDRQTDTQTDSQSASTRTTDDHKGRP